LCCWVLTVKEWLVQSRTLPPHLVARHRVIVPLLVLYKVPVNWSLWPAPADPIS
jgi:hypothetical protein